MNDDPKNPGIDTVQLMADLRFIIQKRSIAGLVHDERQKEEDGEVQVLVEQYKQVE
ncbi:hypothetical protein [Salicibibacter kimchii]|uniref:hypothetical protein n=1 Tax=Salicibibacter kimchii TaxID=2099786 RepID=UPI0013590AE9|nr:hypothetical protein [Salicibibacter kimchii]